jgi:hypothetical protein
LGEFAVALKILAPTQKNAIGSTEKPYGPRRRRLIRPAFNYQSNGDINKAEKYTDKACEMSVEKPLLF